jgi:quinoprotein glucose dehydrogenase
VDLKVDVAYRSCCDYEVTSAPAVVGDLVITGSSIGDNSEVATERGTVRAYDARTGKLRWTWDPIPWSNQQKVRTGSANAWSTLSADPERDMVFIPTGSASPDYFGGERPGNNEHANSVVALKASTGTIVWSFQVVHHDLWDYDVASQPALIQFAGKPAVAVTTKMGNVFVLDRLTGKPLTQVEERPVPKSDIPGETASPTQPFPGWLPMVPQKLTVDDAWGPTAEAKAWCQERIRALRNEGMFTPPSLGGTLVFPGSVGGVNWGSASWDPERQLLFAVTNRLAAVVKLIPRTELKSTLANRATNRMTGEFGTQKGTPFAMYREWLVSPAGVPCNAPPWAALVAFDLKTGKPRWESTVGKSLTLGGAISTAGGLVLTGASLEPYLRAYSTDTGEEIWKTELPASAQSTPMTYEWEGKQYIVICAGGHGKAKDFGAKMGDSVAAFRLP